MMIPCISLSVFLLYPLLHTIVSADIYPGSTLRASNPNTNWTSPNNTFSLSFMSVDSNGPPLFAAAISFFGVPVWKAGGEIVDSNAAFEFLLNGNLRLVNGSGSIVWESHTANRGITTAILDDSGNLSLRNNSVTIWSSFDYPTDTILPNQNFTVEKTLRSGYFSFALLSPPDILTLTWNNSINYWNQSFNSTIDVNLTSPSLTLQSSGLLSLNDPALSAPVVVAYSSDHGEGSDILRFLRLDSDGNLRIYSSARGSGISSESWAAVVDQCQVFGWCGNMGICSYNDSKPICGCPSQNFEFWDPNDSRKGCRRKVEIKDCPGNSTMLQLDHTLLLTYPPETTSQAFTIPISPCRLNCLTGPSCLASTSLADGSGYCYLKVSDFVSGYQFPSISSTSFIKICGPVLPNSSPFSQSLKKSEAAKVRVWVVAAVVLGSLMGLVLLEGGLWWWCYRNRAKFGGLSAQYTLLDYASGVPVQFSYKELRRSTQGFKDKLGAGGFGAVYRGTLSNSTAVAVKQLEGIEHGEKEFRIEVAAISSTHHLNLVRLIGFCSEGHHKLLVYEFMKNGSLDNCLFTTEEQSGRLLNWESRFKIALGTARGITYLHEECQACIVHCDIKPENILLDEHYNAKVSDFGLAKLGNLMEHRDHTLTSIRGTRGYLAPEWLANLPTTLKSDVYSYGMVLLEIVSGHRNFEVSADTDRKKFSLWAYKEFEKGNVERIVDRRLAKNETNMEQVMRAIQVSFWCIQEQPSQRPMMGKVVHMLEGITAIEKPPDPKAMTEGSFRGAVLSSFAGSTPASYSSSSFQDSRVSSSVWGRNIERSPSLL